MGGDIIMGFVFEDTQLQPRYVFEDEVEEPIPEVKSKPSNWFWDATKATGRSAIDMLKGLGVIAQEAITPFADPIESFRRAKRGESVTPTIDTIVKGGTESALGLTRDVLRKDMEQLMDNLMPAMFDKMFPAMRNAIKDNLLDEMFEEESQISAVIGVKIQKVLEEEGFEIKKSISGRGQKPIPDKNV